jgi:hypothetical protein
MGNLDAKADEILDAARADAAAAARSRGDSKAGTRTTKDAPMAGMRDPDPLPGMAEAIAARRRRQEQDKPDEHEQEQEQAGPDSAKPPRDSQATALVRLARELYEFSISDTGETFAVPKAGPKVVALLRGSKTSLRGPLARKFFEKHGKAPAQQALADALNVIEGYAQQQDPVPLYLRVASHGSALWLDLGDQSGQAIEITPGGWTVRPEAPVFFKRTALGATLPYPSRDGDLSELWPWLNITEADRPLIATWLVTTFMPDIPHPPLGLLGGQGTGKTTAERIIVMTVDPSPVPVRKAPRDADSWVTAAAGSWVVGLDNLSTIPDWLSDSLCRAATGDGDVRRKLYTDGDYAVFAFRRCVIINGIDLGGLRGDLTDRMLPVTLDLIAEQDRIGEDGMAVRWQADHPRILGGLLDLAARVMAVLPSVRLESKPRMADFARVLAAVDEIYGTDALGDYAGRTSRLSAVSLSADPFMARLMEAVKDEFTGPSAELLTYLTPTMDWRPPRGWPANAAAVTTTIRRHAPSLRRQGWTVDDLGDAYHDNVLHWRITPPTTGEIGRDSPSHPSQAARSARNARPGYGTTQDAEARLCAVCGKPMDAKVAAATGWTTHPACVPADPECFICGKPARHGCRTCWEHAGQEFPR